MEQKRRVITAAQAFDRMARYCSTSERAASDVERLTRGYGLGSSDIAAIIEKLTELGFLSEQRYVNAFVRSKQRAGWGCFKIVSALKMKRISSQLIDSAVSMIDSEDSKQRLEELLTKKMRSVKYSSSYDLKSKLIRFGMGRGFDLDECKSVAERLVGYDLQ